MSRSVRNGKDSIPDHSYSRKTAVNEPLPKARLLHSLHAPGAIPEEARLTQLDADLNLLAALGMRCLQRVVCPAPRGAWACARHL